jgi:hypothetical protein
MAKIINYIKNDLEYDMLRFSHYIACILLPITVLAAFITVLLVVIKILSHG